jgi:hypothetical protein
MPIGKRLLLPVPLLGSLINSSYKVLSPKMRITLQHLHEFVPADGRHLLVRETGFNEPAHRLMSKIVKAHIFQALFPLDPLPHAIKLIGTPITVASRLPCEDHIRVHRATGIVQSL